LIFFGHFKNVSVCDRKITEKQQVDLQNKLWHISKRVAKSD